MERETEGFTIFDSEISVSSRFRRPFFKRWKRSGALEHGLRMPKREAKAMAKPGMDLSALARASSPRKLRSELIPAWVLQQACS